MEINRNNVIEIIRKSGLEPDKDYGQNYLLEPSICDKIISLLDIQEGDNVLEIGPGIGSLTHFISQHKNSHIDLVDIDERMINFLKIIYKEDNINLVLNDIRKHDVSKYDKIVGNLPYNITTETVTYLLENAKSAKRLVLMCQAEAFPRFSDLNGKEYGPLSIFIHLLGSVSRKLTVKPGSFYPAPKCSSIVFQIDINNQKDFDHIFSIFNFSKSIFSNRRKTINNNLSSFLDDKERSIKVLAEVGVPANKRPEELSPETIANLYDHLKMY